MARQRRQAFQEILRTTAPEKLIFLDESGVTTQMTRLRGRAPRGRRIAEATPQGPWQVLTTLSEPWPSVASSVPRPSSQPPMVMCFSPIWNTCSIPQREFAARLLNLT